MFCNACGKTLSDDARFCNYCGAGVGQHPVHPPKKLIRSRADHKVAGLCGGLALYLELDPTLVRVLWVIITVMSGIFPGLIAYLVAWVIVPEEPLALPVVASDQPATNP